MQKQLKECLFLNKQKISVKIDYIICAFFGLYCVEVMYGRV